MSGHHHSHSEHEEGGHIVPYSIFNKVLAALLVLTAVTVWVATKDFGVFNIVVAMAIASIKAALVIFFFMHGAYENKIVWIYIVLPFVLLVIMIGGVFLDNPFRAMPEPVKVEQVNIGAASK